MPDLQVRMVQSLLAADALGRVEAEHLGEKINGKRVGMREESREGDTGLNWERADVVLGLRDDGEFKKKASK